MSQYAAKTYTMHKQTHNMQCRYVCSSVLPSDFNYHISDCRFRVNMIMDHSKRQFKLSSLEKHLCQPPRTYHTPAVTVNFIRKGL